VSSRAQPEPDAGGDTTDESSLPEPGPKPELPADNSVTTIMSIITPWPELDVDVLTPRPVGSSAKRPEPGSASVEDLVDPAVDDSDPGDDLADVPDILDLVGKPGTALARRPSTDIVRVGPTAVAEDSWDDPALPVLAGVGIGGRHVRASSRRVWVVVVAVLIGLGAIAAVPFVLNAGPQRAAPQAVPDQLPTELDEPPAGFVPEPIVVKSPEPLSTGRAATPKPTPTQTPTANANQAAQTTTEPPAPPPPPPFTTLTIEAEGGQLTGSAWVSDGYSATASGGLIVRNLGNWGGTPGTLTLNGIVFPNQANYTITIHFVHPNGEANRTARVTVSEVPTVMVNFTAQNNGCCFAQAAIINIPAGTRSIRFENPTGHAPSIDKVVITRT
jgi:hypothetical protein